MKKLLIITGILLGTVMILFSACGVAYTEEEERSLSTKEMGADEAEYVTSVAAEPAPPMAVSGGGFSGERMIVRTGQMAWY